jgi:hypothetical protein
MSMNTAIINRTERAVTPELLETMSQKPAQLSRSQFRVRRKTLSSPRPIPDRIEETDYNDTNIFEKIEHRPLFDDRAASAMSPLANANQEASIACLHDKESLRPFPLQVRRPSSTIEPNPLFSPKSPSELNEDEAAIHQDSLQADPLGPSAMTVSIPANLRQTPSDPLSPVSPEGTYLGASDHSPSLPSLIYSPSQRAHSQDGLKIKSMCVPDGLERSMHGVEDPRLDSLRPQRDVSATVETPSYIGAETSRAQAPTMEDCTLELVDDLNSTGLRVSQDYRGSPDSRIPNSIKQPYPTPYPVEKLVESGLELAPQFVPPVTMRKYSYPHPERADPDGLSLRPSVKSSGGSKSKLRFLRRLGGTKETAVADSMPSLPPNLQSCFTVCSSSLLLWSKKDSDYIVQIRSPFTSGQRLNLATPREPYSDFTNVQKGFSIRLVAGSTKMAVAYACSNKV